MPTIIDINNNTSHLRADTQLVSKESLINILPSSIRVLTLEDAVKRRRCTKKNDKRVSDNESNDYMLLSLQYILII